MGAKNLAKNPAVRNAAKRTLRREGNNDNNANNDAGDAPLPAFLPTYTAADKAREMELEMQEGRDQLERRKVELEKDRVRAMNRMAKSNFRLFLLALLKDLSPYIALLIIILFIIVLMKGSAIMRPFRRLDARRRVAFAKGKSRYQRFKLWLKSKFDWLFKLLTPGYRVRLFLRMFLPGGAAANQIPRQRIMSGRCDNNRWIQINDRNEVQLDADGKRGYCFSAIRPEDIKWDLDITKMPDYNELPEQTRKSIQSRMQIIIPFDNEDSVRDGNTFFVPRCDKAYYAKAKDKDGKPIPAKLLEDFGTSCKLGSYAFVKGSYGSAGKTREEVAQTRKW